MWIEGNFKVKSQPFTGWFKKFRLRYPDLFPFELNGRNFSTAMNRLALLTGKPAVTVNEFIGHFAIIYQETCGSFKPLAEKGPIGEHPDDFRNDEYFFIDIPGKKRSYNLAPQNMPAGDLLRDWGVITADEEVDLWNSTTHYPVEQPEKVRRRARDCDFYKFRGRGLIQINGRTGYTHYVDPLLENRTVTQMTDSELDVLFTKPDFYCSVFCNYINDPYWAGKAIAPLAGGDFTQYPLYVSGKTATDYQKRFIKRCQTIKLALRGVGIE